MPTMDIGAKEIRQWHKQRGWADIGYHFVIRRNGTIEPGRALDEVGAHEPTRNRDSVAICLVGGIDAKGKPQNNFTPAQMGSLTVKIGQLLAKYPRAVVSGHNHWQAGRACPSFDWRAFSVRNKFPTAN